MSLANTIRREDEAARMMQVEIEIEIEDQNRHGRVMTAFEFPPIPSRGFDWSAWIDGQEEGATGRGRTEAEAIADLLEDLDVAEELAARRKPAVREDVFAAIRSGVYFGLEAR